MMKVLAWLALLLVAWHPPAREDQLSHLQSFDMVIIGGGATGAGIALDAASRGRSVLLVDRGDFSSQTSSKSTKLVHGGVRYLEKAVKNLDKKQYALVKEALKERGTLFDIAPFAVRPLAIVTPIYKWREVPYYWAGLKFYDYVAKEASIEKSRFLSPKQVKERIPFIRQKGLKGGVVYYDGQFNDTRLNITIILSAVQRGAVALNYVEAVDLVKVDGKVCGVWLEDRLTGKRYKVSSEVVVNATGPFSDTIRKMDGAQRTMIRPSSGTHIVLDAKYMPTDAGILIPKTKDERLLFLLPWQGMTVAGTTDHCTELTDNPLPHDDDVQYILDHINEYLDEEVTEVKAVWTGLRPLVLDPRVEDTSKLCREHVVQVSDSGLISVMGGKWTTYRKMAEDAVDAAFGPGSQTAALPLLGAEGYTEKAPYLLHEKTGYDLPRCERLIQAYGMSAFEVVEIGEERFAVRHEYARTISDVLLRRTRAGFLDAQAALDKVDEVAKICQEELWWSDEEMQEQKVAAIAEIQQFLPYE